MFYLTKNGLPFFIPIGFIGIYRWFWFMVRVCAYWLYKPIQPPQEKARYQACKDVTILVPTIDAASDGIRRALASWLVSDPFQIIFITIESAKSPLQALAREFDATGTKIRVITVKKPNKRRQMVYGVNHTRTPIVIFADDDVIWPPEMIRWILAPFEEKQMGGVGTSQAVMPIGDRFTVWEVLAAYRIAMRNIEITATTYIDGGVCCLSGRTAAYRTEILRDPQFQKEFTHEYWRGKYHQHSGDDKFLTRWMHSHDWKTYIQSCPEAELQSSFKNDWTFLKQLLRWTRNTWRSDIKSLFMERKIWKRHPYVAFSMFDKFWNPFTLLAGPCTVIYLCTRPGELPVWAILLSYTLWLFLSRFIKYLPHFIRRPVDVIHIPAWIVFNYYFVVMKLYCLATLHITEWGTRKTADAKSAPKMIKESRTVTTIGEDGKEEKTIVEIEVEDKNGNGIEDDDGEEDKDLYVPRYPIYERKPFIISKSSSSNAHSSSSSSRRQVPRRSVMGSLMAGVKRSNAGVTTTTPSINNSSNIKSGLPYSSFSTPTSLGSTRSGYQNLEAKGGVGGMIGVPGPVFSKPSSAAISQRPLLAMAHPSIIHQQSYQSPSNTMTMIAPAAAVGGASLPALGRRNPSTVPPSLTTSSQLNMNTNNNNTTTVNAFQPISILKKKAAASASAKK